MNTNYVCPETGEILEEQQYGLIGKNGTLYPFIAVNNEIKIPNFLIAQQQTKATKQALTMYDQKASTDIYRNFLDWLFKTFEENETSFRTNLVAKLNLQKGNRVLITACGLGDDIRPIMDAIGEQGEVYANDLAAEMVVASSDYLYPDQSSPKNLFYAVCDAQNLPFENDYFDAAFHFGGINLFDNMKSAIEEMERVVKPGGRVAFGDEGVASWLKNTEYANIAIENNSLWASDVPINLLPKNCIDVNLSWVLGNCFYMIDFQVSETGPFMNIDVPHKGLRGGTMRTRYFGQLEGVSKESKEFVIKDAKQKGVSVHEWIEQIINEKKQSI